jgi:hypothetical protein
MASTIIQENYSPIFAGDDSLPFLPVFQTTDAYGNTIPFPLVGVTISMKMGGPNGEMGPDGSVKTCSGAWTILDAENGKAQYQWQSTDVNTVGEWTLYITITDGNGRPVHGDCKELVILPVI